MATITEKERKRLNEILREAVNILVKNGIDTTTITKLKKELNEVWTEVNQTQLFL